MDSGKGKIENERKEGKRGFLAETNLAYFFLSLFSSSSTFPDRLLAQGQTRKEIARKQRKERKGSTETKRDDCKYSPHTASLVSKGEAKKKRRKRQ